MSTIKQFVSIVCLTSILMLFPSVSSASWSIQSNAWISKIKSSLTRLRINSSVNDHLRDGLVGYWSFNGPDMINGTVFDRSGSGNNLFFVDLASSTAYVAGKIGQGLYFDTGITDYLEDSQSSTAHNFGTGPFSTSIWFKTTFAGAGARMINKRAVCVDDNFWEVAVGSGAFIGCVDDGTVSCVSSNATVNDDEWHHGVFTRDGLSLKVYVDGTLDNTVVANTLADVSNSTPLKIGDSVCANDYVGDLDEVRVYNRALSAAEAKRLYNMGK